ncbi:MAG: hypothetical protein E3K32_09975 [wastewater metagenome]|nr:hypothetical protein [Candidatus Loosdrechtia aerotolerans]
MKRRDSSLPLRMTNSLLTFHPEWNEGFQDGTLYSVILSGAKGLIPDERDSFLHERVIPCIVIGYIPKVGCPGCNNYTMECVE